MAMTCAALILAAGESKRLGRPKQLLPFKGSTLLGHAVSRSLSIGCKPVVVVTGASAERMTLELAGTEVTTVFNPQWQDGMGQSIACGASHLLECESVFDSVLLMTVDQPLIASFHLRALVTECRKHQHPSATGYPAGRPGIPACVPRSLLAELSELTGKRGAQHILTRYAAKRLSCPEALLDIDTEADLEILNQGNAK